MGAHSLLMGWPADQRSELWGWGSQVAVGVLPGLLFLALLAVGPRTFLLLGPTAVTLTMLALVFVVALPLHTYFQYQRMGLDHLDPSEPAWVDEPEPAWSFERRAPAPPPTVQRRAKSPEVAALEGALRRRLGLGELDRSSEHQVRRAWIDPGLLGFAERQRLELAYADLGVPSFASLGDVRRSYRRLMYLYHPDRHRGDPVAHRLSTELSRRLTTSYSVIIDVLRPR